jgi:hypothetical protein
MADGKNADDARVYISRASRVAVVPPAARAERWLVALYEPNERALPERQKLARERTFNPRYTTTIGRCTRGVRRVS